MKSAELFYSREFPETPISGWAGARRYGWMPEMTASGQIKRPRRVVHPFASQRKLWCLLAIHFDGVDLIFATPLELDQFLAVMSQNLLSSGWALVPGCLVGRPNRHWLSRLPKAAKSSKFRQSICRFLRQAGVVREFRDFYAGEPLKLQFDGVFNNYYEAWKRPVA